MSISLVVAVAENGVIGKGGALPWHLPDDLERFKELTSGHTVVMGRRTFDSIGTALPNRRNIVLTRNKTFEVEGIETLHTPEDVLRIDSEEHETFVIGGAEVFRLFLCHADRVHVTLVHAEVAGDTHFEASVLSEWDLCADVFCDKDEKHEFSFSFRTYRRRM